MYLNISYIHTCIHTYKGIHMYIYIDTGKKRAVYTKYIHAETGSEAKMKKVRGKNEKRAKNQRREKSYFDTKAGSKGKLGEVFC
jgi:hypothetical protein